MKIEKDRRSRLWTLTAGSSVLYSGRRSPWEQPDLMRDALERERALLRDRRPRGGSPILSG